MWFSWYEMMMYLVPGIQNSWIQTEMSAGISSSASVPPLLITRWWTCCLEEVRWVSGPLHPPPLHRCQCLGGWAAVWSGPRSSAGRLAGWDPWLLLRLKTGRTDRPPRSDWRCGSRQRRGGCSGPSDPSRCKSERGRMRSIKICTETHSSYRTTTNWVWKMDDKTTPWKWSQYWDFFFSLHACLSGVFENLTFSLLFEAKKMRKGKTSCLTDKMSALIGKSRTSGQTNWTLGLKRAWVQYSLPVWLGPKTTFKSSEQPLSWKFPCSAHLKISNYRTEMRRQHGWWTEASRV